MILLSRSQREIQRTCKVSPKTIVKARRAIEESGKSSSEILRMDEEELRLMISPVQPRKTRGCVCISPDLREVALIILQGGTVKAAWDRYCNKASEAGQRPLKYAAFCDEVKKAGIRDLMSEVKHLKAGLFAFVKSGHTLQIKGKTYFVCFGIFPLSQMAFVVPCPADADDVLIDALQDILHDIGGAPPLICFPRDKAETKELMSEMLSYYDIQAIGLDIDGVDDAVNDADRYFGAIKGLDFASKEAALTYFEHIQDKYNTRLCYRAYRSRETLFEELDRKELIPLPKYRYEKIVEKTAKIQFDYHVSYKKVRYSVPPEAYRDSTNVFLRISKNRVTIISEEGELLAEHPFLSAAKVRYSTLPEHVRTSAELAKLPWNAARFLRWAKKFSADTVNLVEKIIKSHEIEQQAYSECYWLLNLGNQMLGKKKIEEFIAACQEEKDGSGTHAYYTVKKRLGMD